MIEALQLSYFSISIIIMIAFLAGTLHGATGMAGGIVMAAALSNIVGIKTAIPVVSCALIFSHGSRVIFYLRDTNWRISLRVLLFGLPAIVLGVVIFVHLNPRTVSILMVLLLLSSFPIKQYAKRHQIKTGPKLLASASVVWRMLAGNVIGPGFFLAPFLLGTGMNRLTFVGTMASITLVMNATKLVAFGFYDLMNPNLFILGTAIGLVMIPANWLGKQILMRLSDQKHGHIINVMTCLVIINFVYLSWVG